MYNSPELLNNELESPVSLHLMELKTNPVLSYSKNCEEVFFQDSIFRANDLFQGSRL